MTFALHVPTVLATAAIVMLASTCVMVVVGLTQHVYRGFWWWVAAPGLACAAALLRLLSEAWFPAQPLSELAAMIWPLLILEGVRRFYARLPPRTTSRTDTTVFGAACAALAAAYLVRDDEAWWLCVYSALTAVTLLYSAGVLWTMAERRTSGPLTLLAAALVATALMRLPRLLEAAAALGDGPSAQLPGTSAMAVLVFLVAAIVVLCLCLVMTHVRTEQELRESHQRLRLLANIDMLTAVPNRRHLHELAEELLSSSGEPAAVMLFDIDHFKQINDRHGHAVGDAALRLVAREARDALRAQDVLGRMGGDEFVALLPATAVDRALHGAERIAQRIRAAAQVEQLPALTISVGVVAALPNESLGTVLGRADTALYEAKRQGRGRAVLAEAGRDSTVFTQSRQLGPVSE